MSLAQSQDVITGTEMENGSNQVLTFMLDSQEYGVDILRVQEIKGWDTVTRIPNTPEFIRGVINLRGTIVPIIDLRSRFGLETIACGPTTVVMVLKVVKDDRSRIMGIVVDAVSDVYNIPEENMKPSPDFGAAVDTEFVKGLATVEEQMVIILEIDHLLNSGELAVLETIGSDAAMSAVA